jgi:N-acetylmuramoyl-L-alanine amidase
MKRHRALHLRSGLAGLAAMGLVAFGLAVSVGSTVAAQTPHNAPIAAAQRSVEVVTDHPAAGALTLLSSSTRVVRGATSTPFSTIGVSYAGMQSDDAVQLRTHQLDGSWTPWIAVEINLAEAPDRDSLEHSVAASDPTFVDQAIEYEISLPGSATDVAVHRVQLRAVSASPVVTSPATTGPSATVVTTTAPATSTTISQRAASSADVLTRLGVHARSEWGARPSKIHPGLGNAENGVKMVVVHHTAGATDYTPAQAPIIVHDFQAYDMDVRHYDDLGYNVMVDRFGTMWEGRYGGLDQQVIGAHALGFNSVSMGIAVLGNFVDVDPPQAVIESVAKLAGWKLGIEGYDPTSMVTITADEAEGHPQHPVPLTTPRIVGHKDIGLTLCPGRIWDHLAEIRTLAAKYAAAGTGAIDQLVDNGNHTVTVSGWAARPIPIVPTSATGPVTPPAAADVVVRIDRQSVHRMTANQTRTVAVSGTTTGTTTSSASTPTDGFSVSVPAAPGPHRVCAWEAPITTPPATGLEPQRLIGCRAITVVDGKINPIRPSRLYDSRSSPTLRLVASGVRVVPIAGAKPIPTAAVAVSANITVTGSTGAGFVTAFPCGERPNTSSVNFSAGQTIAAMILTKLDSTGRLCLYASTALDVIVDVTAWFPVNGAFDAVTPTRLLDTRIGRVPLAARVERVLPVAGRAGVPTNASAVALNVVAVNPSRDGWLVVYPCDRGWGGTSTVNFTARNTIANLAVTKLAGNGSVCLYADAATDVVVDITGGFPDGGAYTPIAPVRIMDTRAALMHKRLDDEDTNEVVIRGMAGIPSTATAVVLNLTVTNPSDAGFITLYPCAQIRPDTSNLNFEAGDSIPNLTLTQIGVNGCLRLYNEVAADAIVDVVGWV